MEDCRLGISELEEEEDLIAAAQHVVKALGSKKNLTDNARKILADLRTQLSSMSVPSEAKIEGMTGIEERLETIQEKIMNWEAAQSMLWESGQEEAYEFLNAVDEIRILSEKLEAMCLSKHDEEYELLRKAHDLLQRAMARVEEEFRHVLFQNRQPFEPEHLSFRSSEEDVMDEGSITSFGDDSVEDSVQRDSVSRVSEELIIDLINPGVIPDLRSMANLMFNSNYDQECTQAYISSRRHALDECLFILEMEKLSIEDVLKLEWGFLNSKIRRWTQTMKIFVRVYLSSEKCLSNQIFGEQGSTNLACFVEASRPAILQLLNFGEAMSIGPHGPEKLSRMLDMYEVLQDLNPDIDDLYLGEIGSPVRAEFHDLLKRLGASVRATFLEFKKAIASNTSSIAFAGGGIHHLTRYVMNYLVILPDYSNSLNVLLGDHHDEYVGSPSPDIGKSKEDENVGDLSEVSPMAQHFCSVASILEHSLEDRSKLYRDTALQHFFMMNNIYYMAQKVKGSELRLLFGDDWIRKHNWKFQQHAMNYERASWSSILSLLKDDGIQNSALTSASKDIFKERLRSFYLAFEEIYKTQTAWVIPDLQLREDLRISTSLKVIQAYRTFVGRHHNHLSDKLFKYTSDDLENYILDLFEGSPKSLPSSCRK